MKFYILTFVIILSSISFSKSQNLIWETRNPRTFDFQSNENYFKIDSNLNHYSIIQEITNIRLCSFIKTDKFGQTLFNKEIFSEYNFTVKDFIRTNTGFSLYCVVTSNDNKNIDDKLLPMIIKTDFNGNKLEEIFQYDFYHIYNYVNEFFYDEKYSNNSIVINSKFYNFNIFDSFYTQEQIKLPFSNLLVSVFDSNGLFEKRIGFDTANKPFIKRVLRNIKKTNKNTILVLYQETDSTKVDTNQNFGNILEFDTNAILIKKIDLSFNSPNCYPIDVEYFNDGRLAVLMYLINTKEYEIWEIDKNSKFSKREKIETSFNSKFLSGFKISEMDEVIIYGNVTFFKSKFDNLNEDSSMLYLYYLDKNLFKKWDLAWEKNISAENYVHNVLFFDSENIIVTASNLFNEVYNAKINLKVVNEIKNNVFEGNLNLGIIKEHINLDDSYFNKFFEIYNSNGMMIKNENYQSPIDVSSFFSGIYFLKINNQFFKFIKA